MRRSWFFLMSLVMMAGCSRNNTPPVAAQATPAVGYAAASQTPPSAASTPSSVPASTDVDPTAPVALPGPSPEPVDAATATASPAAGVMIPRGSTVYVRLDQTVDTRRNQPGDVVQASLARPLVVGSRTVLPVGTRFTGHVTVSDASGRLKGRAHIGVALDAFNLNGRRYGISTTSVDRASAAHKKRNGILIGGGAGLGAALGAIAGGGKGALIGAGAGAAAGTAGAAATGKLHVAIPAETMLRFTVRTSAGV